MMAPRPRHLLASWAATPLLQVKTILAVMLRNFDLELITPMPEPDYEGMVVLPKPARVRYTRRKL